MTLPDGLADITLMCFDVDGTLAAADHLPTERTLRALADLAATGVRIVVVTGRALPQALVVFQDGKFDGTAIASNGAIVAEGPSGRIIERHTLPRETIDRAIAYTADKALEPVLFTDMLHLVQEEGQVAELLRQVNPAVETRALDPERLDYDLVNKLCIMGEPATLEAHEDEIRSLFPGVVRSMTTIFDISPDDADKGATVRRFLAANGVDPARVAGVGDSENDIAWLSQVGFPIAVENALPAVKEVATHHIGHHDAEAVAELVEEIVAARRA